MFPLSQRRESLEGQSSGTGASVPWDLRQQPRSLYHLDSHHWRSEAKRASKAKSGVPRDAQCSLQRLMGYGVWGGAGGGRVCTCSEGASPLPSSSCQARRPAGVGPRRSKRSRPSPGPAPLSEICPLGPHWSAIAPRDSLLTHSKSFAPFGTTPSQHLFRTLSPPPLPGYPQFCVQASRPSLHPVILCPSSYCIGWWFCFPTTTSSLQAGLGGLAHAVSPAWCSGSGSVG